MCSKDPFLVYILPFLSISVSLCDKAFELIFVLISIFRFPAFFMCTLHPVSIESCPDLKFESLPNEHAVWKEGKTHQINQKQDTREGY